jgi:hypothetical protein
VYYIFTLIVTCKRIHQRNVSQEKLGLLNRYRILFRVFLCVCTFVVKIEYTFDLVESLRVERLNCIEPMCIISYIEKSLEEKFKPTNTCTVAHIQNQNHLSYKSLGLNSCISIRFKLIVNEKKT